MKIVFDSSADIISLSHAEYAVVPLKVITDEREYLDIPETEVQEMLNDLEKYKGRSSSSCPAVNDWLTAFGDSEEIICLTITSSLSGSYNSACVARDSYLEMYPERKVFVLDTLSAGPEITLAVCKAEELIIQGKRFSEVTAALRQYITGTKLLFMLRSLNNFANNGCVKPSVAKITGILGIRLIGRASAEGTLEPLDKARGEKASLNCIYKNLLKQGYCGGRVMIHHCENEVSANTLKDMILADFPAASVIVDKLRVLCSFYAERGGMLMGFEAT